MGVWITVNHDPGAVIFTAERESVTWRDRDDSTVEVNHLHLNHFAVNA